MSEWKQVSFQDVLVDGAISYGIVQPGSHSERDSVPIIRVNNIKNGSIQTEDVLKVDKSIESKFRRTRLTGGELLITVVGSIGECAIVPERLKGWNVARAVSVARINKLADSRFVKYAFKSDDLIFQMYGGTNDTVQPTLNLSSLKSLKLTLPPLAEQRAIANILSSFDDKIDLLHRQNKTLEAMAETLFRKWFVEEATERVPITNYVDFNPTRRLSKGVLAPYLDMAGVSTSTFNPAGWYDREFSSGTKYINGDTLLARITPCLENGKTAFVTFLESDQVGWGSTEFIVMRSRHPLVTFFTYTLARNQEFRDYAEGCMAGSSGRQRVDVEHLKQFEIGKVTSTVVSEFNCLVEPIPPKLHANMLQIRTLEKLRDTLLPKLMSGEVRVQYE